MGGPLTIYQRTVLDANREAEDAVVRFLEAQQRVHILRTAVNAASQSSRLVNVLYEGGRTDFGRVYVAELSLVQQQNALAVAEGTVARSLVDINRALGGGWQVRLQHGSPSPQTVLSEIPPEPSINNTAEE